MGTGHQTNPRHRPLRRQPPQPRRKHPPLTYRQQPPPAGGLVYRSRGRALLRSARCSSVPRPTMGHQGDPHHARPGNLAPRGNRGPHHPAQGPQGCPPGGGPNPGPRPGLNHLGASGLPPGTGNALPVPLDQAPLTVHRGRALDLGHPDRPHTSLGGPQHTKGPFTQATTPPHLRVPRHPQGPSAHGP